MYESNELFLFYGGLEFINIEKNKKIAFGLKQFN